MYPISFVSLGPGDPELLTIKALSRLQEADAIFLPFTQSKEGEEKSRSLDIVKAHDLKAPTSIVFPCLDKEKRPSGCTTR